MTTSGTKVVHVAGYTSCGFYTRVLNVLRSLSVLFPHRLQVVPHDFVDRAQYRDWLVDGPQPFRLQLAARFQNHVTSPLVWCSTPTSLATATTDAAQLPLTGDGLDVIGGHDDALDWCRAWVHPSSSTAAESDLVEQMRDDNHSTMHDYDYDLVVIGGGSGGMAAAKEAASLGAKVACLDFVKPSPQGTVWGLGGTCVNVGCIPKKLFHLGAQLNESIQLDAASYGIRTVSGGGNTATTATDEKKNDENGAAADAATTSMSFDVDDSITTSVSWDTVRENIQNYIRSLNFKYRVRLREKNVTYLNQLGQFVDAHTIEAVNKKGEASRITSSRFLVCVGGRPTALDCPGGELAISSDDIFALERAPGKTLCVGAGYIALECAGFLRSMGCDVTVAVRSILLRGFDRECVDRIDAHMSHQGVKFHRGVTVRQLGKTSDGRIQATLSDDSVDVYDTVLCAIGRHADTAQLGLKNVGVHTNPTNGRILGKFEQTDCPNIYAIGDVLDNTPELTPVAIQAGLLLARRLFGSKAQYEMMDYRNVCTTVFTPIEYACVGVTEEEAIEELGEANIEVYHREFVPLEWSVSMRRSHETGFAKVIVDTTQNERVIGIHYVGPNAGEVMQGYGVAMKQGLTFHKLSETVGIHPTSSEELVQLSVTKRSGEDAAAGGC